MKKHTKECTPQEQDLQSSMGCLKYTNQEYSLMPIVSSRGTVTYNPAKELAKILKPMVGKSSHNVQNTRDFVEQIKGIRLQQDESIISYDVKALFTFVPIQPVINIIQNKLANNKDQHQRTSMAIHHIINLLEFCLKSIYFVFQGNFYEQKEGAAMGSPLSPIIANIFMEDFETKTLSSAPHSPSLLNRFVDDTFVVIKSAYKEEFFNYINSIEEGIQFTDENTRADGSMPFLDTLVTPQLTEVCPPLYAGSPLIPKKIYNRIATMPY